MKERYRLVRLSLRGGMCYCLDVETRTRVSLETKDQTVAAKLVAAKNEALRNPQINRKIGMAYLAGADLNFVTLTWKEVMADIMLDKSGPTLKRWDIAMRDRAFDGLRPKIVVSTTAEDFLTVLRAGTVSTNVYLRRLQNHALDMGWLPVAALPKKKFPKIKHAEKRAITWEEHCLIIGREGNDERRDFYELLWHLGGSQTDIATLHAEDFNYKSHSFNLSRGIIEFQIQNYAAELNTPLILYYGRGRRSALVADNLQKMGYNNVVSVAGGFGAWQAAGLPVEGGDSEG